MKFNSNVPLSLGVSEERAEVIQKYVTSIVQSQHSDEERIGRIKESFPRYEECIYAIYLLSPSKHELAVEMGATSSEGDE